MTQKTVFSAAEMLLPNFQKDSEAFRRWAVIACDQFTSDVSYWDECERIISGAPSSYDYILPEAFLGSAREEKKAALVKEKMASVANAPLRELSGFVYVERTLSGGGVRRGVVGKLDLEAYDYTPDSMASVRASEMTVAERVPPRAQIRASAAVELPHVLVFIAPNSGVIEAAETAARDGQVLYDFDLMQGGGHLRGTAIEGSTAQAVTDAIAEYESNASLPYAVGDGNHSLAAAKLHYENIKKAIGSAAESHPARYALCEIVSLGDDAIEFEPIYRVLTGLEGDASALFSALSGITAEGVAGQSVKVITSCGERDLSFTSPTHALTVGTLQDFSDGYIAENPGVACDYIHGIAEAEEIGRRPGCAAFLFDGIAKDELLPYVEAHGVLPRKTFSMGDARDKRYYLEARRICAL